MSVLATLFGGSAQASSHSPYDDYWYQPLPMSTAAGIKMTESMAMKISTVNACVRILAETIASLPVFVYRRLPNGDKKRVMDHPLQKILHDSPNAEQTRFAFIEMMQGFLALRGNAYAEIVSDRFSRVLKLKALPSNWVTPKRLTDGSVIYEVISPVMTADQQPGEMRRILAEDMLHVPGLSFNGVVGISPVRFAANSMGLALAAEDFGSTLFKNGLAPSGVVETDKNLSDQSYKRLKKSINKQAGQGKTKGTLVLDEGLKWHQVSIAPNEAQFLETRKFQNLDICRIYRIPPHMVGHLEKATFKNTEQQGINFAVHTIRPWLVRWEQILKKKLIDEDDIYVEFLVDGLLRGDIKSRYEAYKTGIETGFINRNEVRRKENLNKVKGLEKFIIPLNMATIDKEGNVEEPTKQQETEAVDNRQLPKQQPPAKLLRSENITLASLKPFIKDAAWRIVSREIREMEKAVSRTGSDRVAFNQWVEKFYSNHEAYVGSVLGPLEKAYKLLGLTVDFESIWFVATVDACDMFCDREYDPNLCLAGYKQNDWRLNKMTELLTKGIEI